MKYCFIIYFGFLGITIYNYHKNNKINKNNTVESQTEYNYVDVETQTDKSFLYKKNNKNVILFSCDYDIISSANL